MYEKCRRVEWLAQIELFYSCDTLYKGEQEEAKVVQQL